MALLYCFPKGRYESNYEVSPASSCWFLSHILEFSSFKIGDWNIAQLIQIHIIHPQRRKNQQHKSKDPKVHHIFFWGGGHCGRQKQQTSCQVLKPGAEAFGRSDHGAGGGRWSSWFRYCTGIRTYKYTYIYTYKYKLYIYIFIIIHTVLYAYINIYIL